MGWDTFSHELYTIRTDDTLEIRVFDTLAEAQEEMEKERKHALTLASDYSIADRYWIEEIK